MAFVETGRKTAVFGKVFAWVAGIASAVVAAFIVAELGFEKPPEPPEANRVGTYYGEAQNAGLRAGVTFEVQSVEADGDALARIEWVAPLNGMGSLNGQINGEDARFEGQVASLNGPWNTKLSCDFQDADQIRCDYGLTSALVDNRGPQQGSFSARR
ncbi:hypothetical protein [Kineosporia babensis]|uniref:Uncharacterized protein n=1 Tax=Kineosporia babensis TaxID=499548 RepID=A0A9X1T2X2_9ACTN|nr:hypothetical protein [Kineosporia babensis]MCD5315148.1 hypothetical protein [Kineosporia babensis]